MNHSYTVQSIRRLQELQTEGFKALGEGFGRVELCCLIAIFIMFLHYTSSIPLVQTDRQLPVAGYRSFFEPTLLLRLRFVTGSQKILRDAYTKYKDQPFLIKRNDTEMTILPNHYLDELKDVHKSKLSSLHAQSKNLLGHYTYTLPIIEGDQLVRALRSHLTGHLSSFLATAEEELSYSIDTDVPHSEDWVEVDIQQILRTMVARVSLKVFIGYPACRNEKWLDIAVNYAINIFTTFFTLRMLPRFLHPIAARLIPARRRTHKNLRDAERLVLPEIEDYVRRASIKAEGSNNSNNNDEKRTLLDWMIENAKDNEGRPDKLSARLLILTLASIHTTTNALINLLFDICQYPDIVEPLRAEITQVVQGRSMAKQDLNRLQKLDSFMRESQRFSPAVILAPQRMARADIKLKNGTLLPKGSRISFASDAIMNDPAITPNPDLFDAFRAYRKRQIDGEGSKHLMIRTDNNHLHFGHGSQSCPGRFFAVNEIKMIMVRLLLGFEFKFVDGKSRPPNFFLDENVFPDPFAKLMIRMRTV